jgi:hypothetical protein
MLRLHKNIYNAGLIPENKINSKNITTGKAVRRPTSGVRVLMFFRTLQLKSQEII